MVNKLQLPIDTVEERVKPKVMSFLMAVNTHLAFLKDFGYSTKEEYKIDSNFPKNVVEVLFKNPELDRAIIIHYTPKDLDIKIDYDFLALTFFKEIKYMNNDLGLRYYLKKYHPNFDLTYLQYPEKNNKSSVQENFDASISGFAYILRDMGLNILNGTEWEDGLTFDWSAAEKIMYDAQRRIIYDEDDEKDKPDS